MKFILKWLAVVLLTAIAAFSVLYMYIAFWPVPTRFQGSTNLAVVFGAGITRKGDPSAALSMRLQKAEILYASGRVKRIIVSGRIAEVFVMRNYLEKCGVRQDAILQDPMGENTSATVANVKRWLKNDASVNGVVFISQRYHIARIRLLAWKHHITHAVFLAAEPKRISGDQAAIFVFRESLAYIKDFFTFRKDV